MAVVLDLRRRGRLGLRGRRRPVHRPPGRPLHLPRGQGAGDPRAGRSARASTSPPPGRYSDSESDLPMLRAVGHPVAVNPDADARAGRARGGLGDAALRAPRPPPALRRRARAAPRRSAAPARWSPAAAAGVVVSLHELTPEQREIRALARRFADEKIAPHAAAWDREHPSRASCSRELGELGLMGVCVPAEQGGAGADFLAYVLVLEELSRADAGVGVTVAVHTSACTLPLLDHGSPLRARARRGRGARGVRADRGRAPGSDAGAMRTRDEDGPLTGTKQWITNGSHAATILVFARDGRATQRVRRAREGFEVPREEEKLGLQLLLDRRPRARGHARRAARRARARACDRAAHARRRPHRDRRPGGRDRAGGARRSPPRTRRSATRSAARSPGSARSSRSSPTCRPRSRRRARWSGARRG